MAEYKPYTEDIRRYNNESSADNDVLDSAKHIPLFDPGDLASRPPPTKIPILDFGEQGFLLGGVLTQGECRHLIDHGERLGFDDIPDATQSYRSCTRICLNGQNLSEFLWDLLRPHLGNVVIDGDPHDVHIHGVSSLLQGTWEPHKLNNLWRFCRYYEGGHFAPHFDGHFVQSSEIRSMKTFMLYLNDDFTGGSTNFVDESQILYMNDEGKYCAEEKNILYGIQPEPGLAVVFNHHRLHEGQALRSGVKYILRTDILYRRVSGPELSENEAEALRLAQEAERLEASGDTMGAVSLYKKAFKMSESLAASYGCPP